MVTLRMPVGLVFAQKDLTGPGESRRESSDIYPLASSPPALHPLPVYVDEVTPGGAADKTGKVAKGDILSECSAVVLKSGKEGQFEQEGYGQRPYDNWDRVTFDCRGQDFKTVMSGEGSLTLRMGR